MTFQVQWQGPSVGQDPKSTYAADVFSDVLNDPQSQFQQRLVDSGLWQAVGVNYYTLNHTGPITISGQTSPEQLRDALKALDGEIAKFDPPELFQRPSWTPRKRTARSRLRSIASGRPDSLTRSASGGASRVSSITWATWITWRTVDRRPARVCAPIHCRANHTLRECLSHPKPGSRSSSRPKTSLSAGTADAALDCAGSGVAHYQLRRFRCTRDPETEQRQQRRRCEPLSAWAAPARLRKATPGSSPSARRLRAWNAALSEELSAPSDVTAGQRNRGRTERRLDIVRYSIERRSVRLDVGNIRRPGDASESRESGSEPGKSAVPVWNQDSGETIRMLSPDTSRTASRSSATPTRCRLGETNSPLQSVDSAALRNYHQTQFVTSRMLLVVVGNIDRAHIERLVNQSIGQLPRGRIQVDSTATHSGSADRGSDRAASAAHQLHTGLLQRPARKRPRLSGAQSSDIGADGADVRRDSDPSESHLRCPRTIRGSSSDRGRALRLYRLARHHAKADEGRHRRSSSRACSIPRG